MTRTLADALRKVLLPAILGQSIAEANADRIIEQDELDAELDALFAKRAGRSSIPILLAVTSLRRSATFSIRVLLLRRGDCDPATLRS